jgi:hypothetical protein
MNRFLENMMAMLPEWMKMAKDPESVGAKFLNAFAVEFEEIETYMNYMWEQKNAHLADITTIDYVYKVSLGATNSFLFSSTNNVAIHSNGIRYQCKPCTALKAFYESTENAFILDMQESILYVRVSEELMSQNIFSPFEYITLDQAVYSDYTLHHIWNPFDEFAFLFGLRRNKGERNEAFKNRILSTFSKKKDGTKTGLVNHLASELNIPEEEISIGSLSDENYVVTELLNPDGTPTKKYMDYIKLVNNTLPFTWDHMTWEDGYWQVLDENLMGIHYIPHAWDVFKTSWKKEQYQSGVGSKYDLRVHKPVKEKSTRAFKAYVGLKGIEEVEEESIPEIEFKYKIFAKGKVPVDVEKNEAYKYTVIASEVIDLHYALAAIKTFLYHTYITWDDRYGFTFENNDTPGMEIITGETALHKPTDPYVKIKTIFQTENPTVSPSLTSLTVEYLDQSNQTQQYTLNTATLFTQNNGMVTSSFSDSIISGEHIELSKSPFEARLDTVGDFQKGENEVSIVVLQSGGITLDLPKK